MREVDSISENSLVVCARKPGVSALATFSDTTRWLSLSQARRCDARSKKEIPSGLIGLSLELKNKYHG
jgi:hypothetical protein